MATYPNQPFYDQVDRYRYRPNWGCLIWTMVIVVVLAVTVWWLWLRP